MDQIGVPAQPELGHQEPEVVLAGDEVRRGGHMDQDINVDRLEPSVGEGGAAGS